MPKIEVRENSQRNPAGPASPLSAEPRDTGRAEDLEIKDAQLIFDAVWAELMGERGEENLHFPKEFIWLNGAPGAGKGTQTAFIREFRDLQNEPIVMSQLLDSPEARKLKDSGRMVGDKEVIGILFRKLLEPQYQTGALVDGFPRTMVQVQCLKLLYNKLTELRNKYLGTECEVRFPQPVFHIVVLFIDEAESVKRQLFRGRQAIEHNEQVERSGVGETKEVRKTDTNEDLARDRYRTFKSLTYDSLTHLREVFHYHFINGHGSIGEVQARIVRELSYQSSLELDERTYNVVSRLPLASAIVAHARQDLVSRLDGYVLHNKALFDQVVGIVEEKFMPIIRRHAISGMAIVNSEDLLFSDPAALVMLIDLFSERGYHATVDVTREYIPISIDPDSSMVRSEVRKVYRFRIRFGGTEIRRSR